MHIRNFGVHCLTRVANNNIDSHTTKIQIILVGRPQIFDDLVEALDMRVPEIHVDWRRNSPDIAHYVESSIRKSRILSRAPKDHREEIAETLVRNAQGIFIWVDLMLRELSRKSRPSSIRESLHRAPKGLDEMLRHVLESFSGILKDEDPVDLNTMLAWVTCAARPLSMGEIDTLLKLKSPAEDGVINLENKLRKQFASFFTLLRDDGLTTADLQGSAGTLYKEESDDVEEDGLEDVENETEFGSNSETTHVVLCHASIGDFFRDKNHGKVSAGEGYPGIGVNIVQARINCLRTCLELICDQQLSRGLEGSHSLCGHTLLKIGMNI